MLFLMVGDSLEMDVLLDRSAPRLCVWLCNMSAWRGCTEFPAPCVFQEDEQPRGTRGGRAT